MARVQQQGISGITIGMIVFVVLWAVSTVLLVMLYTGQEDLVQQADDARLAKERAISANEERSIELVKQASERGPTAVGLIEQARRETAELATGDAEDLPGTVREKRDGLLEQIRTSGVLSARSRLGDNSLFELVETVFADCRAKHELLTDAEQRVQQLDAEVEDLTRRVETQKAELEKQAEKVAGRIEEVEANRDAFRTSRDEQIAQLKSQFDERNAQADAELTRERQRRAALEEQYADLQQRFGQLQQKLGLSQIAPEPLSTARVPDGRILTAVPGDPVVYINLGRRDRLTLGLEFAVYNADTGIPEDGRAKARIEVISIAPNSAECRIVEVLGNEVILEDDLVANPVYDPNRPLSFMVLGQFDVDRDGSPDPGGPRRIQALVTDWGGNLVDELTAQTDFLVLGAAPPRPRLAGDLSPEEQDINARVQARYDKYQETVEAANSLGVPVLTQDVFLQFLGYSRAGIR